MPYIERVRELKGASNNIAKENSVKISSANGEDGILIFLADKLGIKPGFIVDIGASDGVTGSNSWALLNQYGWSGLLIESDVDKFGKLQTLYDNKNSVKTLNVKLGWGGEFSIDSVLDKLCVPVDFDVLSIDIDGNDYHCWESLANHFPKIVVIEFNHFIPNDVIFIQDADFSINQGSSLRAMIHLGSRKGYSLVATTGPNAFFVQNQFFKVFGIENNSINNMFDDTRTETKIFQLYDGTIKVLGVTRLNWHNIKFSEENFQLLSADKRRYLPPEKRKQLTNNEVLR